MKTSTINTFKKELDRQHDVQLCQDSREFADWITMLEKLEPKVGMEIGAGSGGSSRMYMKFLPSLDKLLSVDVLDKTDQYAKSDRGKRKKFSCPHPDAVYIAGASELLSTRKKVVKALNGVELDFLFIDGSHQLFNICADFWSYAPLVREGGLVGFHDTQTANINKHSKRYVRNTQEVHAFWIRFSCIMGSHISDIKSNTCGIGVYKV